MLRPLCGSARDECALRYIAIGNADGLGPADARLGGHRLGKVRSAERRDM
jgi:hypothetical protein